ncbi:putative transcription factor B3-Domain family [Helianthus anomalus]
MYCSFVKYLLNPASLGIDVPITFVNQFYGENWEDMKLYVYHSSGKRWLVRLKRIKSMPVLTDGWQTVVSDLNLQKDCLLTFLPLSHFGLHLSCYVNGVSGQSYFTINRTLKLGFTIIEDAFVQECFRDNPPTGSYELNYKGSPWTVSIICKDLGIQDDDLLVFEKLDDVLFGLTVYRNEIKIRLSKKLESDEDDVFQISKADYYETLLKDIEEDDNIYIPDENPSSSKVKGKGKGKAKVIVDKSETVEKMKKDFKGRHHIKFDCSSYRSSADYVKGKKPAKVVQNVKHQKKISRNARKLSGDGMDAEFFNFSCKGGYRLHLPVEVVNRAGLSDNLQDLYVQNMNGYVEAYETKTELNGGKLRYAIDGWRKFMSDNNLEFGHMLHFTYVTSQKKIVLNDVTPI